MPTSQLCDPNVGIAQVFETILATLKELDWQQEAPDVFLVYAHDNDTIKQRADAAIARHIIKWVGQIGADIYSDRTGMGNPPIPKATPPDVIDKAKSHDILSSQLGLLPTNHFIHSKDKRQTIILCGSALLQCYASSNYYRKTYYPGFKQAYQKAEQVAPAEAKAILATYVNSQLYQTEFHHVLTELACLALRVEHESPHHGIVPLLLNKTDREGFPPFIMGSTTIRIEDAAYREPGQWQGKSTYQNQGLHEAFFKLVDQLWQNERTTTKVLAKDLYESCLSALQRQSPPLTEQEFTSVLLKTMQGAQQSLIRRRCATLRVLKAQEWLDRIERMIRTGQGRIPEIETRDIQEALADTINNRLKIRRISGDYLPIETCYINLAMVEYQHNQGGQNVTSHQTFHRLPSTETIPQVNLVESIPLEALFEPRELKSGKRDIPKRILIRGRAGIGKTTLAKKSVYNHLYQQLSREQFDWVLWIPLRHLKGEAGKYQLETILYEEYFVGYPENRGRALAHALYQKIKADPSRTLLILDGWDEVAQEENLDGLIVLLNHPSVIITSRPYGASIHQIQALDLELETIGFSEANVMAYLDHREIVKDPDAATAIKTVIQQNSFVRELVNIPIQLDALCYSLDEIKNTNELSHTMTALYDAMITKLWRKDSICLKKAADGQRLTHQSIQGISPDDIKELVHKERNFLGALALNGLRLNQIEFKQDTIHSVAKQLKKDHHTFPITLVNTIKDLSCLQVNSHADFKHRLSYQFLHLTFQEFFAAQWLSDCFTQDKPLSLVEDGQMSAETFIRKNKYNPQYDIVWRFISGLLPNEWLNVFFGILDQGSQDLIGIQHQNLMMHSLKESHGRLSWMKQQSLEATLYDWLIFEIEQKSDNDYSGSFLGRQDAFPETLLLRGLYETNTSTECRCVLLITLGDRYSLSNSANQLLIKLCNDDNEDIRYYTTKALSAHSQLPEQTITTLMNLCTDQNMVLKVRYSAIQALGAQSQLPEKAITTLMNLCTDQNIALKYFAAEALGKQPILSDDAIWLLINLLQDEDKDVSDCVAETLAKHSPLPEVAIQGLIHLLKDESWEVRDGSGEVLAKQYPLPPDKLQNLIDLCHHETWEVREAAAEALGKQSPLSREPFSFLSYMRKDKNRYHHSSLPSQVFDALIRLLEDEDEDVRHSAAQALAKQSPLPHNAIDALMRSLEDKNEDVRASVTQALFNRSALPSDTIQQLINIIKRKDTQQQLRKSAIKILGGQSSLASDAIQLLIFFLKDRDTTLREQSAEALGEQSSLPSDAIQSLIPLLEDPEYNVRLEATGALSKQSPLPDNAIQPLINLLKDEHNIRQSAAEALGNQSCLPYHALIPLLKDKNHDVRCSAIEALGEQPSLPHNVVQLLTYLLKDKKTRSQAARILSKQLLLPYDTLKILIPLLKDKDEEVRNSVKQAFGKRSVWDLYQLVSHKPALLQQLYSDYFILSNSNQILPFYLDNNVVYCYEAMQLKPVSLDKKVATQLKKIMLKAQVDNGIPKASQIKRKTPSTDSLPIHSTNQHQLPLTSLRRVGHKLFQFFEQGESSTNSAQEREESSRLWQRQR